MFEIKYKIKQLLHVTHNIILLEQGSEKCMHKAVIVTGDASFAASSGQNKSLH